MSRHDVPAERLDAELRQDASDDRRAGLAGARPRQLPLGGEGEAGNAGAAKARGLADEEDARVRVTLEVRAEPRLQQRRPRTMRVKVVRRADLGPSEARDELSRVHGVTMRMSPRARIAVLIAVLVGAPATAAQAAGLPQGLQSNAAFAASYGARGVTSVAATAQRVSCYAPEVLMLTGLAAAEGYPGGGGTPCPGATTGEDLGPYPLQDRKNPALLVKDHSESDLHVDPTNARHVIGVSKWFVNSEGYNHLTGFYESFDGGATWPQQGHVPGYEAWTDNSDPVGAFDPWGNFYAVILPYMFDYDSAGAHRFLSARVNPTLPRMVMGIAIRPHGASTATSWLTTHGGRLDTVATTPLPAGAVFDKQWIAIDTSRGSRFFGRVYVMWAVGANDDAALRIYESHTSAHQDGTHGDWSAPRQVFQQARGFGDNGAIPRIAPDGHVWVETASFGGGSSTFTSSLTSSTNGGASWAPRRAIVRHSQSSYDNTTFRAAFGEGFAVGPRRVGGFYPLYLAYENGPNGAVEIDLRASFNGGRSWTRPIRVNDNAGGAEALQPGVAVAPTGTVVVSFYDRRLPCPARGSARATGAGIALDPRTPYGRTNYCMNTAVQRYHPGLRPIGHNVRMSPNTWDPQLSTAHPECICSPGTFIGDYFGVDVRGGFAYTSSVTTYNEGGTNPLFHQQQLVSKLRVR